jgi:Lon protease-like protein
MMTIPIFPLHSVLFPGIPIQLHVFEERYHQLVDHCLTNIPVFGVSMIRRGHEALGPLAEPYPVGTIAKILKIERNQDDSLDLTAIGEERFHILALDHSQTYLNATIETAPLPDPRPLDVLRRLGSFQKNIAAYLKMIHQLDQDLNLEGIILPDEPLQQLYLTAALLQIPSREKQVVLESENALMMLNEIERLLRRERAVLTRMGAISNESASQAAWLN